MSNHGQTCTNPPIQCQSKASLWPINTASIHRSIANLDTHCQSSTNPCQLMSIIEIYSFSVSKTPFSQIAKSYFQIDTDYVNYASIQANQTPIQVTIPHLVKGTSTIGDRPKCLNEGRLRQSMFNEMPLQFQSLLFTLPIQCQSWNNLPIQCTSVQMQMHDIYPSYFQIGTECVNSASIHANKMPIQCTIPHVVKGTSTTGDRLVSALDDYPTLSRISAHCQSYQLTVTRMPIHLLDCQSNAFGYQFKSIQCHSVANPSSHHSITILLFLCRPTANPLPIHRQPAYMLSIIYQPAQVLPSQSIVNLMHLANPCPLLAYQVPIQHPSANLPPILYNLTRHFNVQHRSSHSCNL